MIVVVVGLGTMGSNHLRVLHELDEVTTVVGVDADPGALERADRRFRMRTFARLEDAIAEGADAAIVANPSSHHRATAELLLGAGIPTLIEKPLAPTFADAEAIVTAAGAQVAGVGHVERFNPAVLEMHRRVAELGRVLAISTRRMGPYPTRIRDVGVRLDLLTHDLDMVRHLTGAEFVDLRAVGDAFLGPVEDLVFASGRLSDGTVASLEAGWLSPAKVREVRIVGEEGTLLADTLLQEIYLQENAIGKDTWEALANFRGIGEGNVTRFAIHREEPLRAELRNFLAAARGEDGAVVSLADGVEAVRLAESLAPFTGGTGA